MLFHGGHLDFCILSTQPVGTWPRNCSYFVVFLSVYQFFQFWNYVCHSSFFIALLNFFPEVLGINRIVVIHSLYFGTSSGTFNDTLLKTGARFLENHLWKPGHKLFQTLWLIPHWFGNHQYWSNQLLPAASLLRSCDHKYHKWFL